MGELTFRFLRGKEALGLVQIAKCSFIVVVEYRFLGELDVVQCGVFVGFHGRRRNTVWTVR